MKTVYVVEWYPDGTSAEKKKYRVPFDTLKDAMAKAEEISKRPIHTPVTIRPESVN